MDLILDEALSRMILSPSGWRGIFAGDGDEESAAPGISEAHRIIAAAAAKVFADYLAGLNVLPGAVIVGRDTRPTGEALADAVIRALLAEGREVRYTGVVAAPEIMAFARANAGAAAGFIYLSASHNPIGHNGIKFGLTDGGVLQAEESSLLAGAFRSLLSPGSPWRLSLSGKDGTERSAAKLDQVHAAAAGWKKAALAAYRDFTGEVISGLADPAGREEFFAVLREGIAKYPLGIAADFNGSARTLSIDREWFTSLGAGFFAINERSGEIVHRIVPEGASLHPCRDFLEELHGKDPSVTLGYVPDCDGDRGNLVIWDEGQQQARIVEAQEVFALACVAELASLVWTGELGCSGLSPGGGKASCSQENPAKVAVAVNDPTSLRIDSIARAFGASVFRAEVGEANVVGLARRLRRQGYLVRILGEGSAGGTIIHPSAVRDPIATLGAILKLLAVRQGGGRSGTCRGMGIFEIWCSLSHQAESYREDFTLADIIASLPAFVTTGAYSEDALLTVKTPDHSLLKKRYQKIFLREWEEKKEMLEKEYGISKWEAIAYNGMEEQSGISRFGDAGRGGLKIEFRGMPPQQIPAQREDKIACIWMRGSATESVFRVMADVSGFGPAGSALRLERTLIEWQRRMVLEADAAAPQDGGA